MGKKKKQEKGKKRKDKEEKLLKPDQKGKKAKPEGLSETDRKVKSEGLSETDKKAKPEGLSETDKKAKKQTEAMPKPDKAGKTENTAGGNSEISPEVFRALGDESRIRILDLLKESELCAGDLLKSLTIVQSTLSHHMKILTEAGLVRCRRRGKWSYYSINTEMLKKVSEYIMKWS